MNWSSILPGDIVMSTRSSVGTRDVAVVIACISAPTAPGCRRITTVSRRSYESHEMTNISSFYHPNDYEVDFDSDVIVIRAGTIVWGPG